MSCWDGNWVQISTSGTGLSEIISEQIYVIIYLALMSVQTRRTISHWAIKHILYISEWQFVISLKADYSEGSLPKRQLAEWCNNVLKHCLHRRRSTCLYICFYIAASTSLPVQPCPLILHHLFRKIKTERRCCADYIGSDCNVATQVWVTIFITWSLLHCL